MKLKEFLEKNFKDPKKFLKNIVIVFLLGILLIVAGDVTTNMFFKKENKIETKSQEVKNQESKEVAASSDSEEDLGSKNYEETLKKEVTSTLTQIKGVGRVSVMIYFEGSSESVPAINITDSNKKTEETDKAGGERTITESSKNSSIVTIDSGEKKEAYVVKQVRPSIGGVMVVAEGAENSSVREEVTNAVKTLLALPQNKVVVSPMKKS